MVFRIAALIVMLPPFFALQELKHRHIAVGAVLLAAWFPAVGILAWWLDENEYASLWVTVSAAVFVVALSYYLASAA